MKQLTGIHEYCPSPSRRIGYDYNSDAKSIRQFSGILSVLVRDKFLHVVAFFFLYHRQLYNRPKEIILYRPEIYPTILGTNLGMRSIPPPREGH